MLNWLLNLENRYRWKSALERWNIILPSDFLAGPLSGSTRSAETERRHTLQELETLREAVISMEHTLGIEVRWTAESDEWKSTQ